MSTIGLKYHNEDIHYIIKKPMPPILKSEIHKSKRKFVNVEYKKYNGHQTFGLAHYEAPESKNFLRRVKREPPPVTKPISKKECLGTCKSSQIPKQISIKRKPPKNFVKENMKKVLELQPKAPVPRRVETPRGTVKDLAHLLQMIKIRESEEYGRIPKYLCIRKQKLLKERERWYAEQKALQEHKEKMGIGTMGMGENVYMINNETRQQILDGLKENWNELSKQFLKLPVMTDTWPKIKRKMCLEREIEQLEKDIQLVETHPFIYLEGVPRVQKEPSKEKVQEKEPEPEPQQEQALEKEESKTEEKEVEKVEAPLPEPCAEVDEKKDEDTEIHVHNY